MWLSHCCHPPDPIHYTDLDFGPSWRRHDRRSEVALHSAIELRRWCGCGRPQVGKVIEMPERLDLRLPPGVVDAIKRQCLHQRGRIAAFVEDALTEKLRRDRGDDGPQTPDAA
jgi:hypothetical protein